MNNIEKQVDVFFMNGTNIEGMKDFAQG